MLNPLANPGGKAEAYNLRCRVEYTLEQWDRAANDCAQAVKLDNQNSINHMWLARALGEKASRASFVNAYSLAKRVRGEFEASVRLNSRNAEALADLGEYYYSAPGVVGGTVVDQAPSAGSIVPATSGSADRIKANTHHGYVMYHDPKPRIGGWTERKVPVHMRYGSGTVHDESPRVAVKSSRGRGYEFR